MFDKAVGYILKCGRTKYIGLFSAGGKSERMFERIKYLISQENNISDVHYHKYRKF